MEIYNCLKTLFGGETKYSERGAQILAKLLCSSRQTTSFVLFMIKVDENTMKAHICSPEDAVCLLSELGLSMNTHEALIVYTCHALKYICRKNVALCQFFNAILRSKFLILIEAFFSIKVSN